MQNDKKVSLKDVLNYTADTLISNEDIALLRRAFKDNSALLNALRKLLLPSVGDSEMPIEEMQNDVWMTGIDWSMIPDTEIKSLAVGRQLAIKFIMGGLIKLKILATENQETNIEKMLRQQKDSNQ